MNRETRLHGLALKELACQLWPANNVRVRVRVALALALLAASKVATVYVAILFKDLVDLFSGTEAVTVALPLGLIGGYIFVRMASTGLSESRDLVFARVANRTIRAISVRAFRHLHSLSFAYHLDRKTGGVARVLERGTRAILMLLMFLLFHILPAFVELLLICGLLWSFFDGRFALITAAAIAVYIVFTMMVTNIGLKYARRTVELSQQVGAQAVDSLLNYETVKCFGNEEIEARQYDERQASLEEVAVANQKVTSTLRMGQATISGLGLGTLMVMAALGVQAGTMTVGDLVLVNTYMLQLFIPLAALGQVYDGTKRALIDMEELIKLLGVKIDVADPPDEKPLGRGKGDVAFDHVSYSYDSRRPILQDLSFSVRAGTFVAIVGPSGAGKSTIARLLFRFYDVDGGAIRIDGQDIRDVTQASLRQALAMVPQECVLFNESIHQNIAYGRPGATRAEVEDAAVRARIHDFVVGTPDAYDTVVGERGLKLSGGEKQRVAIARAILKRPRILVFDEATSALDTRTEQEIQSSLREVSRGLTTLVIAHRLSTIVDADEILVIDEGHVREHGTHESLIMQDGLYASMWRQQAAQRASSLSDESTFVVEGASL